MKTFGAPQRKTGELAINITSLIDVIFLLVVFFMVGSTFEKPAFKVRLPEAESEAREKTETQALVIAVDGEGAVYLAGERLEPQALAPALAAQAALNPGIEAALDCDAQARFQAAAFVMDAVKSAGISKLAVRYDYRR